MTPLVTHMTAALPRILDDLAALVGRESPSADLDAVARSADVVAELGTARLGVRPERIVIEGRTHLRWRLGDAPSRVLLLGHHDTVWPIGSLARRPFSVDGGVVRGPGCFDMKAGLVMAFHAVAALPDPSGVTVLVTGDEELGSPTSRWLVEEEASDCAAALVLEASADGGALKTGRKGVSLYEVRVHGRAAHAGLEPERGVNATVELAHQVLAVNGLPDPRRGTSVTPTVLTSGSTTNTVPGSGRFAVDVRVRDAAEQSRVDRAMHALRPVLPDARVEITGGPNRPPLEPHASATLFARAVVLADRLGLPEPVGVAVGGASDGNFTAGVGTPTLDGLGAVGGGAHADDEHVIVAELPRRGALLAALADDLLADPPPRTGARDAAGPARTLEGDRS
ncbi:glutamate carboxypeptidase [Streptomyces aurantiacus]|uniref:Glutamate carboxypeptidase n=2 Tax=Streptomyces aurantiacus TaxID=47760 RepID=A0A7G1NUM0_9ACTN|nr:glutamate carboxypeptidase [Streptomyces aurantiacus]